MLSFNDLIKSTSSYDDDDERNIRNQKQQQTNLVSQSIVHHHTHDKFDNSGTRTSPPSFESSSNNRNNSIGHQSDITTCDEKFNLPSIDTLLNTKPAFPSHLYNNPPHSNKSVPISTRQPQQHHYSIPNHNNGIIQQQYQYPPLQTDIQMQRSYSSSSVHISNNHYPLSYSNYTADASYSTSSTTPPMSTTTTVEGYYNSGFPNPTNNTGRNSEFGQGVWPSTSNNGHNYTAWKNTAKEVSPPPRAVTSLNNPISYPAHHYNNISRESRLNSLATPQQSMPSIYNSEPTMSQQHANIPTTPYHNASTTNRDSIPLPQHANHQHHNSFHMMTDKAATRFQPPLTPPSPQQQSTRVVSNTSSQSTILSTLNTNVPSNNNQQQHANVSQVESHMDMLDDEDEGAGSGTYRFRKGWTKDEHIRFLIGVYLFGRGNWKNISKVITGKSPKQVQSHAQKYFLRQEQTSKTKRSIHDFNLEDLIELLKDGTYRNTIREDSTQKGRDLEDLINRFESSYYKDQGKNNRNNSISTTTTSSSSSGDVSASPSSPNSPAGQLSHNSSGKQLVSNSNSRSHNKPRRPY